MAFCGPCAREQEAYFAIGELTDEEQRDFRSEALAEALERMRRVRVGSSAAHDADASRSLERTRYRVSRASAQPISTN